MIVGIRLILKLPRHKRILIARHQLLGASDRTLHSFFIRRPIHFRSQRPHDDHFFLREILRHKQFHFISAIHPNQRQPNSGIPRRRLHYRPARRKLPFLLRPPDNSDGRAILHAPARVQVFKFREDVSRPSGNQSFQPQKGSAADQIRNIVGDSKMEYFKVFLMHVTG